jgi:hypothetical protein
MTLQDRDKRALKILVPAVAIMAIYWFATSGSSSPKTVAPVESLARAEKRLAYLRTAVATVDGKEALLKQASDELAEREKGLIRADTAAQAQAHLLEIVRNTAKAQTPPIEIRQTELGQARSFGDSYGTVSVSVTLDCRIDELVNLLAALSAQPELVATEEIRFGAANPKLKNMPVRLTVAGLLPRNLVPKQKGPSAF